MKNEVNLKYFTPLLKDFIVKGGQSFVNSKVESTPFIPYTMGTYNAAKRKVFYVGVDTYKWWDTYDLFVKCVEGTKTVSDYIKTNTQGMTVDKIFENWPNGQGFFPHVARLHVLIRTGRYRKSMSEFTDRDKELLHEIGYGNIHSLELEKTLTVKEHYTEEDYNSEAYNEARNIAWGTLDGLKHIINAYEPDYIYVFNWNFDKIRAFQDLDVELVSEDEGCRIYEVKGNKVKIIETWHPSYLPRIQYSPEECIRMLANVIKNGSIKKNK